HVDQVRRHRRRPRPLIRLTFHILQASLQDMKGGRGPALLPLLRSQFVGEALGWLYLHPDQEFSSTDLARMFGVSLSTASREADRIIESGLVIERRTGNLRLLRADTHHALAGPLTDLLALTYGPTAVLGEVLSDLTGVDKALIYGSWAARYRGHAGPVP